MATPSVNRNPKKGVPGYKTGAKTRTAIRAAQSRGCTLAQIGRAARRSVSVVSAIKSGTIKNPPANVATAIQKACRSLTSRR